MYFSRAVAIRGRPRLLLRTGRHKYFGASWRRPSEKTVSSPRRLARPAAAIQVAFTLSVPAVVGDTLRIALPGFSGNAAENCSYVDGTDAWVAGFRGAGRDAELLLIAARARRRPGRPSTCACCRGAPT